MNPLQIAHRLDVVQRTCRPIVETPRGQRFKFDCDRETGLFELADVPAGGNGVPTRIRLRRPARKMAIRSMS